MYFINGVNDTRPLADDLRENDDSETVDRYRPEAQGR